MGPFLKFIKISTRRVGALVSTLLFSITFHLPLQADLTQGLVAWYPFDGNLSDQSENNRELNASQLVFGTDRFGSANMALDIQEYGAFSRIEDLQTDGLVNGYSIVSWLSLIHI